MVDVTEEEIVYRTIPIASKLVPRDTVPPVGVKASVGKVGQFGKKVKN